MQCRCVAGTHRTADAMGVAELDASCFHQQSRSRGRRIHGANGDFLSVFTAGWRLVFDVQLKHGGTWVSAVSHCSIGIVTEA